MAPPLNQYVLLSYELKGTHQAVVHLLLVSGWSFFLLWKRWLLFLSSSISAH